MFATRAFVGPRYNKIVFYTYVLDCRNPETNKHVFYVGSTSDLKTRLIKHKSKSVITTSKFDIIELVYYEACRSKIDAQKRELQLKTGFGRGYLKKRLINDIKQAAVVQR